MPCACTTWGEGKRGGETAAGSPTVRTGVIYVPSANWAHLCGIIKVGLGCVVFHRKGIRGCQNEACKYKAVMFSG